MADVFISYSRQDQAVAERLAGELQSSGKTVWWDRHLKSGAQFSKDIERELANASQVLVLWSKASIESRWVRDEASVGADRDRLVSVTIDGTLPPIGFRQFHTIDLQDWVKDRGDAPPELMSTFGINPSLETLQSARPRKLRAIILSAIAAILVALVSVAYGLFGPTVGVQSAQAAEVRLAILPIDYMEDEPELSAWNAELSRRITLELSELDGVDILAHQFSSEVHPDIAATHLFESRMREQNGDIRLEATLIEASSATQVWTKSYTRRSNELQFLSIDIAHDLSAALAYRVGVLENLTGVSDRALDTYRKGKEAFALRADFDNRLEAIRLFRRSSELAPNFAAAHGSLAYALVTTRRETLGLDKKEHREAVEESIISALAIDPNNALARVAEARVATIYEGDIEKALAKIDEALALEPDLYEAHYMGAEALSIAGEYVSATARLERSLEIAPFDRFAQQSYLSALTQAGQYGRVARYVNECDGCGYLVLQWVAALATLGNERTFERDWGDLQARGEALGVPREEIAAVREAAKAATSGQPFELPQPPSPDMSISSARISVYAGQAQGTLDVLAEVADRDAPIGIFGLCGATRNSLPQEVRADPRYHAAFDDPLTAKIADYRRTLGNDDCLPVFPVKPYLRKSVF